MSREHLNQAARPCRSIISPGGRRAWRQRASRSAMDRSLFCRGFMATQGDNTTWNALVSAWGQGIQCAGAWVARYYYSGCAMHDWNNSIVMPSVSLPFDVLLWQYQENCAEQTIDCNQTNPNVDIQTLLMNKLILPPSGS